MVRCETLCGAGQVTKRVLIVEDSQEIIDLARRTISRIEGCVLDGALNGYDGLLAIATAAEPYDLIVLDLTLPDIDGLEFLRRLAERAFDGAIILASGHNETVLAAAKRLAEIHGFSVLTVLQKPYAPSALRQIVAEYKPVHRLAASDESNPANDVASATLIPYYQPQFDIETGAVVGFEALIRMQLSNGPLVGPSALFAHLRNNEERISAAMAIAELVLRDLAFANRKIDNFPGISLNFDARVLEDEEAMAQFVGLVESHAVPKNNVTIEVIEKSLPHSDVRLLEALTRLHMAGFNISLDDYGIGGSNHDLLRRCPFNELKLDHTLIQSGLDDPVSEKFIATAVETAAALKLRLVAEGIEDVKHLAFVQQHGIRFVQGFLFERPMPIEKALPFAVSREAHALSA